MRLSKNIRKVRKIKINCVILGRVCRPCRVCVQVGFHSMGYQLQKEAVYQIELCY